MIRVLYNLFRVEGAPWGDYGDVLYSGISWKRPRIDGVIQLERTGPRMPDLTVPSYGRDVVASNKFREKLISSGLVGFTFRTVNKSRIVKLEWELWPSGPEPFKYPPEGEPENYILRRKHHPPSAEALGELWEIIATSTVRYAKGNDANYESDSEDSDFFTVIDDGGLYLTGRAKQWFEENLPVKLEFRECTVKFPQPHSKQLPNQAL